MTLAVGQELYGLGVAHRSGGDALIVKASVLKVGRLYAHLSNGDKVKLDSLECDDDYCAASTYYVSPDVPISERNWSRIRIFAARRQDAPEGVSGDDLAKVVELLRIRTKDDDQ